MKKALITGAMGQDGSYLSEFLLARGYEVHGTGRGIIGLEQCNYVPGVKYHVADMRDYLVLENIFRKVWPDEVYNLAAQVFVPASWTNPAETFAVNVGGLANILKIVDTLKKDTKVYQASSSEMFGNYTGALDEAFPMNPVSPYGVSKCAGHKLAKVYRDKGLFVVAGILFNHESPRRGEHMVTRKITRQIARWYMGDDSLLLLGNPYATRDWGHARDYVEAMWLMMQQQLPDDFVIGTGESHSVDEFVGTALEVALMPDHANLVRYNVSGFTRENELFHLKACPRRAEVQLGWRPKTGFKNLVREMVEHDIALLTGQNLVNA